MPVRAFIDSDLWKSWNELMVIWIGLNAREGFY